MLLYPAYYFLTMFLTHPPRFLVFRVDQLNSFFSTFSFSLIASCSFLIFLFPRDNSVLGGLAVVGWRQRWHFGLNIDPIITLYSLSLHFVEQFVYHLFLVVQHRYLMTHNNSNRRFRSKHSTMYFYDIFAFQVLQWSTSIQHLGKIIVVAWIPSSWNFWHDLKSFLIDGDFSSFSI